MYHRKAVVAGSFYPSNAGVLEKEIKEYLKGADSSPLTGRVIGLISPHAGYIYSGPVAAHAFKNLVDTDIELAVVLAPSHRARFNGASVIPEGVYETPLGDVEIDSDVGSMLVNKENFGFIREAHELEHSLEVQVPFIQAVLKKFKIVPVIVGTIDLATCREIAQTLYSVLSDEKRKFAVVISTDLSHYHSYEQASRLDNLFIDSLKKFDDDEVKRVLDSRKAEACGEGPVLTGMNLCRLLGAEKVEVMKYANSGDTAGSKDQVVGYLAAALVKSD